MKFGLPMGVFRLGDLVGVDITNFINSTYARAWPDRVYTSQLTALLAESKRLGQKSGRGWYAHSKGKAAEDPAGLQPILAQSRRSAGLARTLPPPNVCACRVCRVVSRVSCRVVRS